MDMTQKYGVLVIDWQEKLVAAMSQEIATFNGKRVQAVLDFARQSAWPILVTEQYPKGLGRSLSELGLTNPIEKMTFSACATAEAKAQLSNLWNEGCRQLVVVGMETHICVFQTVQDCLKMGFSVIVLADAVLSRHKLDWQIGLKQMEGMGADIQSTEMFLFSQLGEATHPLFRSVSRNIR